MRLASARSASPRARRTPGLRDWGPRRAKGPPGTDTPRKAWWTGLGPPGVHAQPAQRLSKLWILKGSGRQGLGGEEPSRKQFVWYFVFVRWAGRPPADT